MSKRYCISFLIFESVEKGLNYLLENPNMIPCTFFVKLLLGGEVGQISIHIASTSYYLSKELAHSSPHVILIKILNLIYTCDSRSLCDAG
jgi:hypothetical protein